MFRVVLFIVFFSAGAIALGISVLCPEIEAYYHNESIVADAQGAVDELIALNADYDALLHRLDNDPNLVERLAPITVGVEANEPNTVYPHAEAEQLEAARQALEEQAKMDVNDPVTPVWLNRCSKRRNGLFYSGSALILISFICFGRARPMMKDCKND